MQPEKKCEVGVTVVRWCCHTHTGSKVSSCVGSMMERPQSHFGPVDALIVCAFLVDFWWPVNAWLKVGVLNTRNGGAVGVAWPFWPSFRFID